MIKFLKKIRDYFKVVAVFIFFLISIALASYMLPREKKFRYEYYTGSVWLHDNLTAKFSFSIYKTEAELETERDSVLKQVKPYFMFNAYEFADKLNQFKTDFEKKWEAYTLREFGIDEEKIYKESPRYFSLREMQQEYYMLLSDLLERTYLKGVVQQPEAEDIQLTSETPVKLVRGNVAEEVSFGQLYSIRSAYQHIQKSIEEELSNDNRRQLKRYYDFFEEQDMNRYLIANVMYDSETTEREKKARYDDVSLTTDYVAEGTRIISNGEIVTPEKTKLLDSYKKEYEQQRGNVNTLIVQAGRTLVVVILFLVVYFFLYNFRREVLNELKKIIFILFMMLFMLFLGYTSSRFDYLDYYIVPFTILPIILRTFFDERIALFIHIITVMLASFLAPSSFEFIFVTIMAGMVALFSLTNLYRRSKFFLSAILIFLTYSLTYVGVSVIQEGNFSLIELKNFQYFSFNGVLVLLSFLLIYAFEKLFGFLSDTTLMELSDTNQPLLRKLAEMAPATFQHSMQVANLSEEAVRHIGGNPMLVRTGALYHDIGKMIDASYFTENQLGGSNPHANKDLKESARIIIDHVNKGKELAKKHNLPEPIIDFILTHHGTSTTKYFLKTFQNQFPDKELKVSDFQYPGPRPMTKETAVLMMADSVEAASRSLPTYSKESIGELVERIIDGQMAEGQFENADITFKDVRKVKEVFKTRLNTIYHARIAYPK